MGTRLETWDHQAEGFEGLSVRASTWEEREPKGPNFRTASGPSGGVVFAFADAMSGDWTNDRDHRRRLQRASRAFCREVCDELSARLGGASSLRAVVEDALAAVSRRLAERLLPESVRAAGLPMCAGVWRGGTLQTVSGGGVRVLVFADGALEASTPEHAIRPEALESADSSAADTDEPRRIEHGDLRPGVAPGLGDAAGEFGEASRHILRYSYAFESTDDRSLRTVAHEIPVPAEKRDETTLLFVSSRLSNQLGRPGVDLPLEAYRRRVEPLLDRETLRVRVRESIDGLEGGGESSAALIDCVGVG